MDTSLDELSKAQLIAVLLHLRATVDQSIFTAAKRAAIFSERKSFASGSPLRMLRPRSAALSRECPQDFNFKRSFDSGSPISRRKDQQAPRKRVSVVDLSVNSFFGDESGAGFASSTTTSTEKKGTKGLEPDISNLANLTTGVNTGNLRVQIAATQAFRKLLSSPRDPPFPQVIAAGVVPRFVQFLTPPERNSRGLADQTAVSEEQDQRKLQFEAAWALTNIASSDDYTASIVEAGALPPLLAIIGTSLEGNHSGSGGGSSAELVEQAVWCIANIAGDGPALRDTVLVHGGLAPLLKLIDPSLSPSSPAPSHSANRLKVAMRRNLVWTLSNLCRNKPYPELSKVSAAVPVLLRILHNTDLTSDSGSGARVELDPEILADACWSLSYVSDGEDDRIEAVVGNSRSRMVATLVDMVARGAGLKIEPSSSSSSDANKMWDVSINPQFYSGSKWANVCTPALRTLGNIASGNEMMTQRVLDAGAVEVFLAMLPQHEFTTSASASNSNSVRVSVKQNVLKECIWAISNIAAGTPAQVEALLAYPTLLESIVECLSTGPWVAKKEAAWVLSNIVSNSNKRFAKRLVRAGALAPVCELLTGSDADAIKVALETLSNVLKLDAKASGKPKYRNGRRSSSSGGKSKSRVMATKVEEAGGVEKLELLLEHENEELSQKATKLMDVHFGDKDEEDIDENATDRGDDDDDLNDSNSTGEWSVMVVDVQ